MLPCTEANMKTQFLKHIQQGFTDLPSAKLLVAVSGGVDSMVLLHLSQACGWDLQVVHCNFNLRGLESDGDQKFVEGYCASNQIICHVKSFDTLAYAASNKVSIQIAARELRYDWFDELLDQTGRDYLMTAHHLDDVMETFLINLSRGTGLKGLTGIPERNHKWVRPLLVFSRQDIETYAVKHHIQWREDRTNAETKYVRNKIRKQILPILREINPQFSDTFEKTISHLKDSQQLAQDALDHSFQEIATQTEKECYFSISKLKELSNFQPYLQAWLQPYGFKSWNDVYALVIASSGKKVYGMGYVLLRDRKHLILTPISNLEVSQDSYVIEDYEVVGLPIDLKLERITTEPDFEETPHQIYVDADCLQFPLELRRWKQADYFYPLGLKGKKKLSKFFKDEKLSQIEKENMWVLTSNHQIVWLVGKRLDDRFKLTNKTTNILKIKNNP